MPEIIEAIRDNVLAISVADTIEIYATAVIDRLSLAGSGPPANPAAYLTEDGSILLAEHGGYLLLE